MANLRVIHTNVADSATITASTTATGFSIENVKNTKKTSVHRSLNNSVVYTLTWTVAQKVSAVSLPATNLVDGATIRVEMYNSSSVRVADSTILTAALNQTVPMGSLTYNSNSFPYNGATKTSVWFNQEYDTITRVVITVTNNSQIDCARIVCGTYWESSRQVSNGITLGINDTSVLTTSRAGDIYTERGPVAETMQFQLQYLNDTDRQKLQQIMRAYGSNGLLFVCVFPDNTNPEITQSYSIYGRSQDNNLEYALFSLYNRSMTINSW